MEGVFRFKSWFLNARGLIIGILRYLMYLSTAASDVDVEESDFLEQLCRGSIIYCCVLILH